MVIENYSKLALIYDKVMAHVNYKMWAHYIKNILNLYKIKKGSLLDISCGTGTLLKQFSSRKYSLTGSDLSFFMLKNAHLKTFDSYVQSDARFPVFKNNTFNAVFMLYDSINYLLSDKDVIKTLNEIYNILKSHGIFIFDFVTKESVMENFDNYYESNTWDNYSYQRNSWFDKSNNLQFNEFTFLFNSNSFCEKHIQKIRSQKEWFKLINASLFNTMDFLGDFSFLPPDIKNERIHCICRKTE